jgi:hypothetical protein
MANDFWRSNEKEVCSSKSSHNPLCSYVFEPFGAVSKNTTDQQEPAIADDAAGLSLYSTFMEHFHASSFHLIIFSPSMLPHL